MSSVMVRRLPRVVLDTNILVSGTVYAGKPRKIISLALEHKIKPIISPVLLSELNEVLSKKFKLHPRNIDLLDRQLKKHFTFVHPRKIFNVLRDEPDNRVLEAAFKGNSNYIVTSDKELLNLVEFKGTKILTASQFLEATKDL